MSNIALMGEIDHLVDKTLKRISDFVTDTTNEELPFPKETYDFVMDGLYALQDTQLAKHAFYRANVSDTGEHYLLFYGVMNACYMQREAVKTICNKLSIDLKQYDIHKLDVFNIRNSFASHGTNRKANGKLHSYILCRNSLELGYVSGYSSNHPEGTTFQARKAISELLLQWNQCLKNVTAEIHCYVMKNVEEIPSLWSESERQALNKNLPPLPEIKFFSGETNNV